jgi:hypothetical protein
MTTDSREEAERLAREEAERLAREEAERVAKEEAERLEKEEAEARNERLAKKRRLIAYGIQPYEAERYTAVDASLSTIRRADSIIASYERKAGEEAENKYAKLILAGFVPAEAERLKDFFLLPHVRRHWPDLTTGFF